MSNPASLETYLAEIESLKGRLPDLRPPLMFRFAAGCAAVVVLMVALAYIAIVVGLIWLVMEYLISHVRLLGSGVPLLAVVFYVAVGLVFLTIVGFLVKPLFRFGDGELSPTVLEREQQPDLYRFVDALCDALGTPRPHHIQVVVDNSASASLHGFAWGLFSRKPVLTLGLTMVRALETRRLTGIIAHELAHFTQHGGLRFMRVVNTVNLWFARMVYERDAFDMKLAQLASIPVLGLPFRLAALLVSAGRWVLYLFMLLAHASSGIVSRRGEYDADRFTAAVVGSEQVAPTLHRVALLDVAMNATRDDLQASMREHRLADNLPELAVARVRRIPRERKDQLLRLMRLDRTQWHHTHPSLVHRTQAAKKLKYPPLFGAPGAAAGLFRDFEDLAKQQTRDLYQLLLQEEFSKMRLIPTAELVEEIDAAQHADEALGRFYQGKALLNRPILPGLMQMRPPDDIDEAVIEQEAARRVMIDSAPQMHKDLDALVSIEERLRSYHLASNLIAAGFQINPTQFKLSNASPLHIANARERGEQKREDVLAAVHIHEQVVQDRLMTAARLLRSDRLREAMGPEKTDQTIAAMDRLQACSPTLTESVPLASELSRLLDVMVVMLQSGNHSSSQAKVNQQVDKVAARIRAILDTLKQDNLSLRYPFAHADSSTSLGEYFCENLPKTDDPVELVFAAGETLDRFEGVLARAMAGFAELAESVESALGLEAQAQPTQPDEFEEFLRDAERLGSKGRDVAQTYAWIPGLAAAAAVAFGLFLGIAAVGTAAPTVTSTVVPHHPKYQPTILPASVVRSPSGPAYDPYHFFTNPTPQPNYPPGYQPPGYQPPRPGYPNQPNYPGGYPNQPTYPNQPNYPGNQPNRPGYPNTPQPNRPNYPGAPQPNRPSTPQPYRPSSPSAPRGPSGPSPGGPSGPGF